MVSQNDDKTDAGSPKRGRLREDVILHTALRLVGEGGFERTTIDAIAAHAKASKATIYARWDTKDKLVAEALRRQSLGSAPLVAADTGTLRGDLIATLAGIAGAVRARDGVSLVSLVDAVRDHRELRDLVRTQLRATSDEIGRTVGVQAVRRGELRTPDDVPAAINLAVGHLLYETLFSGRVPGPQARSLFVDTFLLPMLVKASKST